MRRLWKRIIAIVAMHAMCRSGLWTDPAVLAIKAYEIGEEMLSRE